MNNSNNSNNSEGGGNTNPPSMNKKRFRKAILVLNNYSEDEYTEITQYLNTFGYEYIIGKEIGECGTPHLQGYVEFKKQVYFTHLKKINERAHWENARGTRTQNITYCSKDGDFVSTFPLSNRQRTLQDYTDVVWKPWQEQALDICTSDGDMRTIHWFWEPYGNVGKTFLVKYLVCKYDVILSMGKATDVFNQCMKFVDTHGDHINPKCIIMDIPRTVDSQYVSYTCLEALVNNVLYSGKYEGGQVIFHKVPVIVFANHEPDYDRCSYDRWHVVRID